MYAYYTKLKEPEITPIKAGFLFLLCAAWVLTGLVGHDPWKPDEAYGFGLIYHIIQSHDWIVPTLAGEPYLDKPPLYYWTAALFAKAFASVLPLHDGARLATGFYTALTLLFVGFTGRELFGNNRGWPAAIILIGCLGMLIHAHEILTDNALLAGCAMMLYGYALSPRRAKLAGVILGIGLGIGFMSKGVIAPMLFLLISSGLLFFRNWRTRTYFTTLGIALLCALPWLVVWPWLLFSHSPELFIEWAWTRNVGRWFSYARSGKFTEVFYYLKALPWLAWPAAPLAAWTVWEVRKRIVQEAEFQLLLVSFVVMLVVLSLVPDINDQNGMPMLLADLAPGHRCLVHRAPRCGKCTRLVRHHDVCPARHRAMVGLGRPAARQRRQDHPRAEGLPTRIRTVLPPDFVRDRRRGHCIMDRSGMARGPLSAPFAHQLGVRRDPAVDTYYDPVAALARHRQKLSPHGR